MIKNNTLSLYIYIITREKQQVIEREAEDPLALFCILLPCVYKNICFAKISKKNLKLKIILNLKHMAEDRGWNDPPKNVGAPTGNLKINLNKRVAFPLDKKPTTESASCPLKLPPMSANASANTSSDMSLQQTTTTTSSLDLSAERERVMNIFEKSLEGLSSTIQSSVKVKLKALDNDWMSCDEKILNQLIELANCERCVIVFYTVFFK
jgi:hypothetical protein